MIGVENVKIQHVNLARPQITPMNVSNFHISFTEHSDIQELAKVSGACKPATTGGLVCDGVMFLQY